MFEVKTMSAQTLQRTTIGYSIWNLIRYITIGVLVYQANDRNVHDIKKYKRFCCDCYYISKDPTSYGLKQNTRFDLSYCVPSCTDCNYCESKFNNTAELAFEYTHDTYSHDTSSCPVDGYTDSYNAWSWNWNKDTGCSDAISISSLHFFSKRYDAYGIQT